MARVAFMTFAILKVPYGNDEVRGFEDLTPPVFELAEQSPGFIARAKEIDDKEELSNFEREWGIWGEFCVPRFYTGGRTANTDTRASTLSLWQDLESVHQFVYSGLHLHSLKQRHEWFVRPPWPGYAIWWVSDDHIPTWKEASDRLEHLHDHGPTPHAFDFRKLFDADGNEVLLSHKRADRPHHGEAGQ